MTLKQETMFYAIFLLFAISAKGYEDVNECLDQNGHCQDICVNTNGSYYCACSDPEFSVAQDQRHCIAEGVEVDCGQDEMTITLPKSLLLGLDREHLRLIDPECTATENETHFFLQTKTDECGTILKHTKDHAIYSNMVSEIPIKENQIVTRVRDAMIPFHCYYSKWGVVSSIGIRPSSTKIVLSSKGFGKFTLSLDLFRSPEFTAPFSQDDFPVEFTIRERVYFEARVDTIDTTLSILALDCYATPSQDRNSQPRYDIIKDGCSVDDDDTLQFHDSPGNQSQRWSLEAFQYVSKHPYVFFHCQVQVCDAADPASRCARGCIQRRRRSEKVLHDNPDDIYALAQGPLALNRDKREAEVDEAVALDKSTLKLKTGFHAPVLASLGVLIVLCLMGMIWLKVTSNKQRVAKQFIPLYEDLQK